MVLLVTSMVKIVCKYLWSHESIWKLVRLQSLVRNSLGELWCFSKNIQSFYCNSLILLYQVGQLVQR
jgi:hypothetical protein